MSHRIIRYNLWGDSPPPILEMGRLRTGGQSSVGPAALQHLPQRPSQARPLVCVPARALQAGGCAAHLSAQVRLTSSLDYPPVLLPHNFWAGKLWGHACWWGGGGHSVSLALLTPLFLQSHFAKLADGSSPSGRVFMGS